MAKTAEPVVLWKPHPGPQTEFLSSPHYEVFYGGAAGGGKSDCLLVDALGQVSHRNYRALILRKSFPELSDLILRSRRLYPEVYRGARYNEANRRWTFPSGAAIEFGYLDTDADAFRYQGQEFTYCVGRGTPILMADGSFKEVQSVCVGDMVSTLQGPRRVTFVTGAMERDAMSATVDGYTTIIGSGHKLLSPLGWVCPEALRSTLFGGSCSSCGCEAGLREGSLTQGVSLSAGLRRLLSRVVRTLRQTHRLATGASSEDVETGCAGSCGERQEGLRPERLSFPVALLSRIALTGQHSHGRYVPQHAPDRVNAVSSAQGSQVGCLTAHGSCDGQSRSAQAADQSGTPSPVGVETLSGQKRGDGSGSTHGHTRKALYGYYHPYTRETQTSQEDVHHAYAEIVPVGVQEVYDLRVEGASHYISFGGIISQNCAFDELTHFSEWGYQFVCSRVRTTDPALKCYVRATSNPGGQGHHWVKARFIDPAPPKTPIYDEFTGQTRIFIPSLLKDNPSLARTDYGKRLLALPEADRKALLEGDWDAYTGTVFQLLQGIHTWTWDQFTERTGQPHIPEDWPRFRVMDWGFARPFATYWIAVDREGRGYVYREWYGVATDSKGHTRPDVGLKMEPSLVAERIAGMEQGERIQIGWTGPDLFSAGRGDTTAGITIYEWFAKVGVHFNAWNAGRDSRYAKKQAFHERLKFTYKEDGTISEWPGLIFLDNCKHAIRTIPALEYDEARAGEDINSASEDHAYDAISGWCLMRPWKAKPPKPGESWKQPKQDGTKWM